MEIAEARGILLAVVMSADIRVRMEEVEAGRRILARADRAQGKIAVCHWGGLMERTGELEAAITRLLAEPEEVRAGVVADLWEMAISDTELHVDERDKIHELAHRLGVPPRPDGMPPLPVTGGV